VSLQDATLPGYPRIKLNNTQDTTDFVKQDICCGRPGKMAKRLWLLSTHSVANITPLHRQSLRGQKIVVMEDPGLHIFSSTVPVIGLLSLSIVKLGSEWVFAIRHRPSEQSHTILRQSSHGALASQTALRARSSLMIVADLCLLS
jgi:hypothetical protein